MAAADQIVRSTILISNECPVCGVLHAFPEAINDKALTERGPNGRQIYCPNGHQWHYTGKTDATKAREEADRERERRERAEAREQRTIKERDRIERQRRATAGHLTRAKRRIAAGVCPCCTQKFDDLAGHMNDRHPGYGEPA